MCPLQTAEILYLECAVCGVRGDPCLVFLPVRPRAEFSAWWGRLRKRGEREREEENKGDPAAGTGKEVSGLSGVRFLPLQRCPW